MVLEQSKVTSGDSALAVNGRIENFAAPVITAEYKAKVSLGQMGTVLKLTSRQSGWISADGSASYKSATDYAISGLVKAWDVNYRASGMNLRNVRAEAKIDGGPKTISIDDLKAYALGGEITAKAVIRDFEQFKINGELHRFNVRELATLATARSCPTMRRYPAPSSARVRSPIYARTLHRHGAHHSGSRRQRDSRPRLDRREI